MVRLKISFGARAAATVAGGAGCGYTGGMRRDEAIAKLKGAEDAVRALGATSLYLYGSTARDEAGPKSDVDVFIEYDPAKKFSILNLVGVQQELSERLGAEVDIATRDGLHRRLKRRIEQSAIRIF